MSDSLTNSELSYFDIYEQYVDEASFLWLMHTIAVDQPHYSVTELFSLEKRIDSQLNALMGNLKISWNICEKLFDEAEAGEIFTAAVLAFRSRDQQKIQSVVQAGMSTKETSQGLLYALAWLPGNRVNDWIKRFFTSKDLKHKCLAVQACNMRQENPAEYLLNILNREDCRNDINLYIASLKISGELKRFDLLEHVTNATQHENEDVKFWAIRSAILLGDKLQVSKLEPYLEASSKFQHEAMQLVFRVLPVAESRQWVSKLADDPSQVRSLITITGVMGDPLAIDWLLQKMNETEYARVSTEAFCMITGTDIVKLDMTIKNPTESETVANENPDDATVKMHDDENLPWPDVLKVSNYWQLIKPNYILGQRYLLGSQIAMPTLKSDLQRAYQRQRHAIAYEIALLDNNEILINTRGIVSHGGLDVRP